MGLVFNIQKFSVHDGPGIRTTVFIKGCPLNCHWCHNIESQSFHLEMEHKVDLCTGCQACVTECPHGAITVVDGKAVTDEYTCLRCGNCVVSCLQNGRKICGEELPVAKVIKELLKDKVFYKQSGGGVTFSGGEPMAQIDFLENITKACKSEGLHVAVDTSGFAPWSSFERIVNQTDLFLYDLKMINSAKHLIYTAVPNELILENLRKLSDLGKSIFIRIPVIPTVNDDQENIDQTILFLQQLNIVQVNLLPYHNLGKGKAPRFGKTYKLSGIKSPTEEDMNKMGQQFIAAGFKTIIGGLS